MCLCDLLVKQQSIQQSLQLLLDPNCCLYISSLVSVMTLAESTVQSVITP